MSNLPFKQVDVFTAIPFRGNPVAVVLNADELKDEEMQRIANWTNLSETTFILSSRQADYRLRIFTTQNELPFAGHPTIGSAHAVREAGIVDRDAKTFVQECGAGLIPLQVDDSGMILARVPTPKILHTAMALNPLMTAMGTTSLLDPLAIDVGPVWLTARLEQPEILHSLEINNDKLAALSHQLGIVGVTVYAIDKSIGVRVRSFAPDQGINEDPVCGSGNACVAAHLKATDQQHAVGETYIAFQGESLGRDGRVQVSLKDDDVLIGGMAVTVIDGKITL
ncbi:MAG: PhzF family phenazine biosynthesis protein [Rhizonema sp. NSF051]|nr:PhzF family phenazine biosynthesis protein [Rhizonema sp. NSF051]